MMRTYSGFSVSIGGKAIGSISELRVKQTNELPLRSDVGDPIEVLPVEHLTDISFTMPVNHVEVSQLLADMCQPLTLGDLFSNLGLSMPEGIDPALPYYISNKETTPDGDVVRVVVRVVVFSEAEKRYDI